MTHCQCDARPAVTFPASEYHRPSTIVPTKLYCLVTEAGVATQKLGETRTRDLSIASPTFYHSAFEPQCSSEWCKTWCRKDIPRHSNDFRVYSPYAWNELPAVGTYCQYTTVDNNWYLLNIWNISAFIVVNTQTLWLLALRLLIHGFSSYS